MSVIFNYGMIWLKADFHLHTKADKEFKYDQAPNDFVKLYIEQLKSAQIGIGIISNHNKFDKDEFKALYQIEDDLDNQTIYKDVIKAIKSLKGNMQFIFATHNANIPVLGDSEKIIACNFEPEKINVKAGTIDNPDIQIKIVSIMEGGQEAFNKRKNIYDLWRVE